MEYFLVEDTKLFRSGCFPAKNRASLPEGPVPSMISAQRTLSPFPLPSREGDSKPSPLAGEGRERGIKHNLERRKSTSRSQALPGNQENDNFRSTILAG